MRSAPEGFDFLPGGPPSSRDVGWEMDVRGVRRELTVDLSDA